MRAAAHGLCEQAQVTETTVRVDDADLEGVRVEPRARGYLEAAAVPGRFADGRVCRRQPLAFDLDGELARLPVREVSESRVPERRLAHAPLQARAHVADDRRV